MSRRVFSSSSSSTFSFGGSNGSDDALLAKIKELMMGDDDGSSSALSSFFQGELGNHMGTAATVITRTTHVMGQTTRSKTTTTVQHLGSGQQPRRASGSASASSTAGRPKSSTAAAPRPRSATTSSATRVAGGGTRPASAASAKARAERSGAARHAAGSSAGAAARHAAGTTAKARPTSSTAKTPKTTRPASAHATPTQKHGELAAEDRLPQKAAPKDEPTAAASSSFSKPSPATSPAAREETASGLDRNDAHVAQKLAKADAYAKKAPPTAEKTVKGLALYLASVDDCDITRARCIYRWLTINVAYDTKGYFSGHYGDCNAEGVLRSRRGVCSGYANLFKALAETMGLAVETVHGYAKGYAYDPSKAAKGSKNHAWNAVRLAGEWRLVDACWGAGHVNGTKFERRFNDFYFATKPSAFIINHLPEEETWQLLATPLTKKEYWSLVNLKPAFHELGLSEVCLTPRSGSLRSKGGHFQAHISQVPAGLTLSVSVVDKAQNMYLSNSHGRVESDGAGNYTLHAALPHPGHYDVNIFGAPRGKAVQDNICSYAVEAMQGCPLSRFE